jgi:serine/threonine-protein kinase
VVADLFKTEAEPDSPDPLIGRKLDGRYEVLGRLGVGGTGVVYRARQAPLGRFVAIKVLHQDAAVIPEWRRRFEREAKALSVLAHPNVVPVTDSGIDRGVPFLVMELLQGKTLQELIKEGPLLLWRALDIARQLLRGLAFAHGKGIVHRDLKPANVFLQALPDQADHVRLLDFGMAKFLEGSSSRTLAENLTHAGVVFGTPAYMSPEQVKGASADARTDVYAAGVLLFELIAGKRPFNADTYEGYMGAHLTQPVPSMAKLRARLPAASQFQAVVEKAMAKAPASRFKDAGAMLAALEAVVAKVPAAALRGGSALSFGARLRRYAIGAAAVGVGVAGAALYLGHGDRKPAETAVAPAPAPKPAKPAPHAKPAPVAKPVATAAPAISPPPPAPAPPPVVAAPPAPVKTEAPTPPAPPVKAQVAVEEKAPPAEQPEPEDKPDSKAQPRTRARNPWREPAPAALRSIRDRVNRGAHMSQKALRPVYEYAHQNPTDPRPWLLLGHAYAQTDWYSDSVERYVHGYHVDSTCRGDPQMLADLLKAAAHPTAGRAAARVIRDVYGAEAIPSLEKEMKRRANEKPAIARLAQLRESLPR